MLLPISEHVAKIGIVALEPTYRPFISASTRVFNIFLQNTVGSMVGRSRTFISNYFHDDFVVNI